MDTVGYAINAFRHYAEDATGRTSDDITMPNPLIYYYLNMFRQSESAALDRQLGSIGQSAGTTQTIPCLELVEVDVVESPFVPATGCYFLKGKYPLPTMVEGLPIQVTTVAPDCKNCDGEVREFTYVPWANFQYAVNSRIEAQKNSLYYTIKNYGSKTDIYIYTNSKYNELKAVALTLIPKNPIEVTNFPKCGESVKRPCSYLTDKFIIDPEIESRVFQLTLQAIQMARTGNPRFDVYNNTLPDVYAPNSGLRK